ncbi:Fibrous sheath-interacting protein 2 like protein [Argiope bruennichi]|uniref:Fibrous sheath-interacting protein 2 like protein n=1 Tax=Argiope bruennichi TaxID=94029 RepID=A0A8T0FZE2_ARGBR|nr:Fibrous sheath-interacting protein 2 like protein [Argiope bruennichi]
MSEEVKDTESQQVTQVCDENHEEATSQSSISDYMQMQNSSQERETTFEDAASTPRSVRSSGTTDRDGLTASECESDELFSSNERQEAKRQGEKKKFGLSERIEYLARPKKDYLDRVGYERIDGVLPEKALPSWPIIPLPTKLPVASYPYEITMTKLGENVYLPPPGMKMDLQDENNFRPPKKIYHSLHDPYLKAHFNKRKILKHLMKNGYVSKSGRVICSLDDINEYREYTRRILAERIQQKYRDKREEEKRLMELEMARLDVEHLEEICRRREKARLDRKDKLENFWLRKAEEQIAWAERGLELEKKWFEDREVNIARRKAQALAPKIKRKAPKIKESKRKEILEGDDNIDNLAIDEILKEEEEASSLDEILREQAAEVSAKENTEEQVEDSKDKFIIDSVKPSSKPFDVLIEPDRETITEEIQPEQNLSTEKDISEKAKSSEQTGESNKTEQSKNITSEKNESVQDLSLEKDDFKEASSSDELKQREEESRAEHAERNVAEVLPEQDVQEQDEKDSPKKSLRSEKDKLERKLSSSSNIEKELSSKRKEAERKSSSVKFSPEKNLEEESTDEKQSSDLKNKGVMAEPKTFIRRDSKESPSESD